MACTDPDVGAHAAHPCTHTYIPAFGLMHICGRGRVGWAQRTAFAKHSRLRPLRPCERAGSVRVLAQPGAAWRPCPRPSPHMRSCQWPIADIQTRTAAYTNPDCRTPRPGLPHAKTYTSRVRRHEAPPRTSRTTPHTRTSTATYKTRSCRVPGAGTAAHTDPDLRPPRMQARSCHCGHSADQ